MLKLILSGNVGNDATVKETENGKVVNFSVAVSKNYKNSKGERIEKTEWVRASIWRSKDADLKFAEYIRKGKKMLIEGEPYSSGYQNKDGQVQSGLEVTVREFEFLN